MLRKDEDILYIKTINENVSDLVIPFSEKDKFLKLGDKKMILGRGQQKYHEDMYGKIIAMDLHAEKEFMLISRNTVKDVSEFITYYFLISSV